MRKAEEYPAIPIEDTGFILQEFIPPEILEEYGEFNSLRFVNINAVRFLAWLKIQYDGRTLKVNNWFWVGKEHGLCYRGFRPSSYPHGAPGSDHRIVMAVDFDIEGIKPSDVHWFIDKHYNLIRSKFGLTKIEEDTKTWTHVSFAYTGTELLLKIPYYG